MINSANEYKPSLLNPFCATWVKNLKSLQRMYELISAFATQYFAVFERQFSAHVHYETAPVSSQRIKQRKTVIPPETIERHSAHVLTVLHRT